MLQSESVRDVLRAESEPVNGQDIVSLGVVREIEVAQKQVNITLAFYASEDLRKGGIEADVQRAVQTLDGAVGVHVDLEPDEEGSRVADAAEPQAGRAAHLNEIDRVLAVLSGKGGVGKSLITAMLAVELRRRELRVGLMDADITGPSIPKLFGLSARPRTSPVGIAPVLSREGVRVMSINLLLPHEDDAVIWCGPLISGAVKQFWADGF